MIQVATATPTALADVDATIPYTLQNQNGDEQPLFVTIADSAPSADSDDHFASRARGSSRTVSRDATEEVYVWVAAGTVNVVYEKAA